MRRMTVVQVLEGSLIAVAEALRGLEERGAIQREGERWKTSLEHEPRGPLARGPGTPRAWRPRLPRAWPGFVRRSARLRSPRAARPFELGDRGHDGVSVPSESFESVGSEACLSVPSASC